MAALQCPLKRPLTIEGLSTRCAYSGAHRRKQLKIILTTSRTQTVGRKSDTLSLKALIMMLGVGSSHRPRAYDWTFTGWPLVEAEAVLGSLGLFCALFAELLG